MMKIACLAWMILLTCSNAFIDRSGDKSCSEVNWKRALSGPGWANCSSGNYLNGLQRANNANLSATAFDGIDNIESGRCCIPPHEYKDETPVCQTVDWKTSLSGNNKWASCPEEYFLQGFYRSNDTWLHNIEQALCCRPRNFKSMTADDCYDEDVATSLDYQRLSKCRDWYYMVGLYKGGCDKLYCIEMFRCCRIRPRDMVVLGHWLLNGHDKNISLKGSPSYFIAGRCLGSKALFLNQSNSFARTPIINLNGRSFTIAFWIKQTRFVLNKLAAIYSDDWWDPWQFQLSTKNQEIIISRHAKGYQDDVSLGGTKVTLDTWTHVAVTWEHVTGFVLIYADGKEIGNRLYPSRNKFFEPTGNLYQIGNVGSGDGNNQFYGSVMDFYVFGTALSLDQINKLRGVPIIVNGTTKAVPGGTVVVAWEPPLEGACPVVRYTVYYREVLSPAIKSKWHSPVTVNKNTTSYTLHLNCTKEYDIAVTSLSASAESALNDSKIWNFKTGGDVPSPPVINKKETKTLRCDVNLTWSPPADNGCPLTMYSIYYQQIQSRETGESWYQVNVSNHDNIMETNYTISLACGRQYKVEISAWNELGESGRSRPWIIKTISDKNNVPTKVRSSRPSSSQLPRTTIAETNFVKFPASESGNDLSSSQLAGLVAGLGVLLIIIVMIIFSLRRKAQKNKQLAHNSRTRRSKSTIIPLWRWEVLREQVVFKEEIGRGAFGKVLKGIYKESPGIDVFYEPRTQIVDFKAGLTVAIKVLGDNTDEEARTQFLEEIELMKVIGSHRNVVSMLGCCVKSDPIFLLLEYVPYGDLQHWLRNKRIQKSYQRHYYNDVNNLTPEANDVHPGINSDSRALLVENEQDNKESAYCDKPAGIDRTNEPDVLDSRKNTDEEAAETGEEGKLLKDYDKDSTQTSQNGCHGKVQSEEDFIAKDLLSFAWQIARGMNFLSSNGFVHRDLAARNVLLGEDKVVKISDFGLMRKTHEDVYKLKKGKKIPVKWLAPEALYSSEYTTKSDVWSFGVLLWELSTMGGNPYPGINNKEMYSLLKTGYRMEKPDTCSDKLYQLVLNCWKEDRSERPTFESVTRLLEKMMQEDTPYLDFESLDESKEYYCSEKLSEDDITD